MGEEGDSVSEKPESVANENGGVEKNPEGLAGKKVDEDTVIKEIEEDKECNVEVEAEKMDVDKEVPQNEGTDEVMEDEVAIKEEKEKGIAYEDKHATNHDLEKEETKTEETEETKTEETEETKTEEKENTKTEEVEETKTDKMEEDLDEKPHDATEDQVEDEIDTVKQERENTDDPKKGKGSKARAKNKNGAGQKDKSNKSDPKDKTELEATTPTQEKIKDGKTSRGKEVEELKTPATPTSDRPVRKRKSVERLVAVIERETRDFHVDKGRGTALKDIPNVAYKLSRKKTEDTFKLLHAILFARRGKAAEIKQNISRFSGFVWNDNEEKHIIKIKEKLDKCVKEKLVEFCDVLDIPVSKANTRKEDMITKLVEFLMAPHATTSELLSEKEQSSKGKKRKRASKSTSENRTSKSSSKGSSKKGDETKSTMSESEDELGEEDKEEQKEDAHGSPERSGDEMPEDSDNEDNKSESEDQSDEGKGKQKHGPTKSSAKKGPADNNTPKKRKILKTVSPPPKKAPAKTPSGSKNTNDADAGKKSSGKKKDEPSTEKSSGKKKGESTTEKRFSGKKKDEPNTEKKSSGKKLDESTTEKKPAGKKKDKSTTDKRSSGKKKGESISEKESFGKNKDESTKNIPASKKSASKESAGAKVMKVKEKLNAEKSKPNDNELRQAIVEILKEVDFNTATCTDILRMLAKKYNMDFTPRKSAIKLMIQEELTKLADAEDTDDKADGGKDERPHGVKA